MDSAKSPVPWFVTPLVAKVHLYELIDRTERNGDRFLIRRRKLPVAVLLSFEDFSRLAGVGPEWLEEVHRVNQQR